MTTVTGSVVGDSIYSAVGVCGFEHRDKLCRVLFNQRFEGFRLDRWLKRQVKIRRRKHQVVGIALINDIKDEALRFLPVEAGDHRQKVRCLAAGVKVIHWIMIAKQEVGG